MNDPNPSTTNKNAYELNSAGQRLKAQFRFWNTAVVKTVSVILLFSLFFNLGFFTVDYIQSIPLRAQCKALRLQFEALRPRLQKLPAGVPSVDNAREWAEWHYENAIFFSGIWSGSGETMSVSLMQQAVDASLLALHLARDENRLRELLSPVGEALERTPWYDCSRVVVAQKTACQQQYTAIVKLRNQGKFQLAEVQLLKLLAAVNDAQRQNVEALQTDTSRSDWLRLSDQIPERLRQNTTVAAISNRAEHGHAGWKKGDWMNARLCYTGAAGDLQKLLDQELTAEEKSRVQQGNAERITRLEKEKADLAAKLSASEKALLETKAALETQPADSRVQVQELERGIINRRITPTRPASGNTEVAGTVVAAGMQMVRIQPGKFMMGSAPATN